MGSLGSISCFRPGLCSAMRIIECHCRGSISVDRAPIPRPPSSLLSLGLSLEEIEKQLLHEALETSHGNISEAARLLKMTRNTLRYRLAKYEQS